MSDPLRSRVEALREKLSCIEILEIGEAQEAESEDSSTLFVLKRDVDEIREELDAILAADPGTAEAGLRADSVDALWCIECGYRRGTSLGQTRNKCPHGHGSLVRARLLTLEEFAKLTNAALRSGAEGWVSVRELYGFQRNAFIDGAEFAINKIGAGEEFERNWASKEAAAVYPAPPASSSPEPPQPAPEEDDADYKATRQDAMRSMFDEADLPQPAPALKDRIHEAFSVGPDEMFPDQPAPEPKETP